MPGYNKRQKKNTDENTLKLCLYILPLNFGSPFLTFAIFNFYLPSHFGKPGKVKF